MSKIIKQFLVVVFMAAAILLPSKADALILISGNGSLGSFTGTFNYNAINSTSALLQIYLKNTTPAVNGGYITAFAFNNPFNSITGASLVATDLDFSIIGGSNFQNGIGGQPNGQFDIGASTGGSYTGGGTPQVGIATGVDETFNFTFTGTNLTNLTDNSFFSTLSSGSGAGEGYKPFVVRFRGFANGGSDKVPGVPGGEPPPGGGVVPEPASMLLLGSGIVGMLGFRRKKQA